ncbi:hypothetical protein [Aquimarina addita]
MKKIYLILVSLFFVSACSNDDTVDSNTNIEVNGTFTYEIPECDNSVNPELICTNFVEFVDGSTVDILIGGDIVYRADYEVNQNIIIIEGLNFDVSFRIIDMFTLERLEEDQLWLKSEE